MESSRPEHVLVVLDPSAWTTSSIPFMHVSLALLFNDPDIIALPDNTTDLHQHIVLR
ncbi:hypothetical protein PISMIDRAFT_17572 [Pisolithus microcarpus 441]|uniref:Uncharacterized protein n=1 Tax=Pisolithus microcarpus 441 TaxID=765257 RepID=A0A0C9YB55_9AGAM|nr:hypothetical protein PISMIDRAFT_17572 [Pisolithus microcarpus 441]